MFDVIPTYKRYRTLFLTTPMLVGEDVYALQTALNELGFNAGITDGVLGPKTGAAIKTAQRALSLTTDGMAGGITQQALAMGIAEGLSAEFNMPLAAFRGQLEFESGFRLGNYSPPRSDGNYDAGVAQRNTQFTSPARGFDVPESIRALGANTRKHYDLFYGLPTRRRWALAQGAWNAPAFACFIAREEGATRVTVSMTARPGSEARTIFENYVRNSSVYLTG